MSIQKKTGRGLDEPSLDISMNTAATNLERGDIEKAKKLFKTLLRLDEDLGRHTSDLPGNAQGRRVRRCR